MDVILAVNELVTIQPPPCQHLDKNFLGSGGTASLFPVHVGKY